MARLGVDKVSELGVLTSECGLEPVERDDGLWPDKLVDPNYAYNRYLKSKGYDGDNPWHDWANAAEGPNGEILSGWYLGNNHLPARVREEDSETPYMTGRAIEFMEEQGDKPFLLHLSYIKPHWPYIVPAPYHDIYGSDSFVPVVRHPDELVDPNPIYAAFSGNVIGTAFKQDSVREAALGAYMGLIKQIDDQMGVLFNHLRASGQIDDTVIVITSDHGDYLGDHWLGEKDLFHDASVRVPMIIYDPSPQADATRGTVCDALVESIDLVPTFVEMAGGTPRDEWLEGRSLVPFIHGERPDGWRQYAISEYDYSITPMASQLGLSAKDARLFMVADDRWKFMHAEGGFPPMLFDLQNDPMELRDLGRDPAYGDAVAACYEKLFEWTRRCSQRTTISERQLVQRRGKTRRKGIVLGISDDEAADANAEILSRYRGKASKRHI
jgi:arylsulfatase A-like enzyme